MRPVRGHPDGCRCADCRARSLVEGAWGGIQRDRFLIPTFFCLVCEEARAIIIVLDADDVHMHHCLACGTERVIDGPLPPQLDSTLPRS